MFQYGNVLKDKKFIKQVFVVAIPMMLQQLITNSVNLLDNIMVGRLGDYAISGVALSNKYFMLIFSALLGVSGAATIYMAQYYGGKQYEKMKQGFLFNVVASIGVTIVIVGFGLLFPREIIGFFSKDTTVINHALQYFTIAAFTFLPQAISTAITSSMRAMGETRHPLISSVLSVVLNAFFNYCFIFGNFGFPALGVAGAAVGTFIARLLELTYLLVIYYCADWPFKAKFSHIFTIPKEIIKNITAKAFPLTVNEIIWSLGMITLFRFYATRGNAAIAGMTIASTTSELFFILFSGMAVATNVLVAHPLGANDLVLARKNAYQLRQFSVLLALTFSIMIFIASFITPHLYNISDEVFQIATNIIRVHSCFFWIYVYNVEIFFIIRAGGDVKSTLLMDAVFMWAFNVVIVGLFAHFTDIPIILLFISGQSTDFVKMIVSTYFFKKEHWLKNIT